MRDRPGDRRGSFLHIFDCDRQAVHRGARHAIKTGLSQQSQKIGHAEPGLRDDGTQGASLEIAVSVNGDGNLPRRIVHMDEAAVTA
jgi:hypothetical protein